MTAIERLCRDFAVGVRLHAKTPVATACAVIVLSLGVAATSASFALLNALFIRPLPVRDAGRLVRVYQHTANRPQYFPISYAEFEEIRRLLHIFSAAAAEEPAPMILGAAGSYERVWGEVVSVGYFPELGVTPLHGRFFDAAEEQAGDAVAVIGARFWERRFGRNPDVLNVDVRIDGRPFRVVGVAAEAFHGTVLGFASDLWIPIRSVRGRERAGERGYFAVARLAPHVGVEQARDALDAVARRLEAEHPESNRAVRFAVFRESEGRIPPPFRDSFLGFSLLGLGVAMLVTMVACANVAGVLLARAAGRRTEMGVRLALGASPGRIAAQLLTEGAALSLPAGALGMALAWQATRLMSAIRIPIARGASVSFDLGLDSRTLGVSVAVTVAAVLLVGLAPALESSRLNLVGALKDVRDGARRRSRARRALLSAQVAVSMALLAGGGFFLRSLQHARDVDLGFDPVGVVATAIDTGPRAYSPEDGRVFWSRLLGDVRRLPGVESASLTARLPLELGIVMTSLAPEEFAPADKSAWPSIEFAIVETGYFETMRIPLVEGRDFTDRDIVAAPAVAIVNDVLARQFWRDAEAIGRHLVSPDGGRVTVVGVARRSKYLAVGEAPKPYVYFPLRQGGARAMTIVARGAGDAGALLRAIGGAVRRLDPEAPLYDVTTMSERVAVSLAPARGGAAVLGGVALMALALTAVGLFGAVAHTVSRRTYEIGVRRALGATDGSVVWLMARDAVVPVAIGITAGVAAALAAWPAVRVVLYDVRPFDPLAVGLAPAVLLSVCAIAAWVPSRRATRMSAAAALRCE